MGRWHTEPSQAARLPFPGPALRSPWSARLSSLVQTIVKDAGSRWPMLTKTNDAEWSMVMKVKMQA
jgi:hypothetical protein